MTAPSGPIAEPMAALRDMLAASSTFQAWVGAANEDEAKEFAPLIASRVDHPARLCIVDMVQLTLDRRAITSSVRFEPRPDGCSMLLYFRSDVEDEDDEEATTVFLNVVGLVMRDIALAAGKYDQRTLAIKTLFLATPPRRMEPENRATAGDYFEAAVEVAYTRDP